MPLLKVVVTGSLQNLLICVYNLKMIKKILIVTTIILALIVIISLVFFGRKDPQSNITIAPTKIPSKLTVISVNPPQNKLQEVTVIAPIAITFNQELDPTSIRYQITPFIDTEVKIDQNSITFTPKTSWVLGQETQITITNLKSKKGAELTTPYRVTFKPPIPTGEL